MNSVQTAIGKLVERRNLTKDEATEAMKGVMSGEATPSQISSFLTALRMKGETVDEITAFATAMRELAIKINPKVDDVLVDTCGTGGDKIKTFNISTAAMFAAAGAGIKIAKHGNRSVTGKAGSADIMEALGARIDIEPEEVQRCIETVGIGFMFAPRFHIAMKHAASVRQEIGIRTVFNILGPLTNPAGTKAQIIGVYDSKLTEKLAHVLAGLGCTRAMVFHGMDGIDEISTLGNTKISELENDKVRTYTIKPEDFNLKRTTADAIAGKGIDGNLRILLQVLRGNPGPCRDIVLLNAAAAIMVGGKARDILEGISMAASAIDSGRAYEKVVELVKSTGGNTSNLRILEAGL